MIDYDWAVGISLLAGARFAVSHFNLTAIAISPPRPPLPPPPPCMGF